MNLNAPTKKFWMISVIIAAVALLAYILLIPVIVTYSFWLMTVAFVLLAMSTVLKGM